MLLASVCDASAAFVFRLEQVGASVVVYGSGTLDTSGLITYGSGGESAEIDPTVGLFSAGTSGICTGYTTISGPTQLGPGTEPIPATSGSGDIVGVGAGVSLVVPEGYVSGSQLSDTDTYFDETIAQLGLAPGIYNYTWGSGATADSLTINIGVVPEPASVAVVAIPALALLRRRRRVSRRA